MRGVTARDWTDPSYALAIWFRSNESTYLHMAVDGLGSDDDDVGATMGSRAQPSPTRLAI